MKERPVIFERVDWFTGGVVAVLAMAVYTWTAAPGVTLLDSGEFLTAAVHFGVPHPTGYPLWTFLAWLWQLLPLGHPAWEVALFSGLLGALAAGLLAALGSSVLRWIFSELPPLVRQLTAVLISGFFALTEPVWSQAVIAEVYTLHALLCGAFLVTLYGFVREPQSLARLLWAFFFLALAFANHHLALAWVPLPFLVVLLLRRELLADLLVASLLTACLFYLALGLLSQDWPTLKTSLRFTWLVFGAFAWFLLLRRGKMEWSLVAYLPLAVAAGLLPYVYLPLASSTNPPMNWCYTRTAEGFYASINRSQYWGSLDQRLLQSVGKLTGTAALAEGEQSQGEESLVPEPGRLVRMQQWVGFFWARLLEGFSPVGLGIFFLAFGLLRRGDLPQRTWLYVGMVAFFLSAFLQPTLDDAKIDRSGWWLQRPFHTYTMLAFALGLFLGAGCFYAWLQRRRASWMAPLAATSLLLWAWPIWQNYDSSTQRGHWWGWLYGREMLADLPKNAVVFGGTDPGRFVPTWMILGEGTVEQKWKRDPDFDRRDLYIITQNAVIDPLYLRYIRDHYSAARPPVRSAWEKWLGRAETYPEKPLLLPTDEEVKVEVQKVLEAGDDSLAAHGAVAEWIFQHNKDEHEFFVEESFPMPWTYRYGWPEGFLIRLQSEQVNEIPAAVVERDFAFWEKWIEQWENDPLFLRDYDARKSFSKLRASQGNLYRDRKMNAAAVQAYRQALRIDPTQDEALLPLSSLEWEEGRFDEVIERWRLATQIDPNNDYYWILRAVAERRKARQEEAAELEKKLAASPEDLTAWQELAELWVGVVEKEKAMEVLQRGGKALPQSKEWREFSIGLAWQVGEKARALALAQELTELAPEDFQVWLTRAAVEARSGDGDAAQESLLKALRINDIAARREARQHPDLRPILQSPEFLQHLGAVEIR